MDVQNRLAERAKGKTPSAIRELLKYMKIDDMISLGGGYPNPDTFIFEKVNVKFKDGQEIVIDGDQLKNAAQYGPSDAYAELKKELIKWHEYKDNVKLNDDQVVVLNGCQEGLFMMSYLFTNNDDSVILSEPVYPGTMTAFSSFSKNYIAIPIDENGMQTGILEKRLETIEMTGAALPKFIYTIPNGHNPGGVALSLERRQHILDIANQYELLILEDDPYQLVKLDDRPQLPTLQSLDKEGRVIRLDSFSKIFAPGLRIGYASGPADIMRQFVLFKQSSNLHTSTFIQVILLNYLKSAGFSSFRELIKKNCQMYRNNRDAMVEAARKYLPSEIKYNIPGEGMFIWFELPEKCDAERMINEHCENLKVLLVPGSAFSTQNGLKNYVRASFSLVTPDRIEEGIRRFSEMFNLEMSR